MPSLPLTACVSFTLIHASIVQAQSGPMNLDFERGKLEQTPAAWFVPTPGYAGTLSSDDPRKGKGYTLQWALERIPRDPYEAFVFLDADSTVSPSFLSQLDHDIQGGKKAIQGYEATKNPVRPG